MARTIGRLLTCSLLAVVVAILWPHHSFGPEPEGLEAGAHGPSASHAEAAAIGGGADGGAPGSEGSAHGEPSLEEPGAEAISLAAAAGSGNAASAASVRQLVEDLTGLTNRPGDWGVLAVSLDGGDTLVNLGGELPMAPASNMKIFTSAAALHHLGPDFRFPTWLLADGSVRDGVLEGDLVLYGTGDPTLGLRNPDRPTGALADFVEALRSQGIHTVRGDVLGDGTYFRGDPRRPSWNPDDLNDWFAAPVSALSFNENMVSIQVRSRAGSGGVPQVVTHPRTEGLPVVNRARIVQGATGTPLAIVREDPDDPIEIRGDLRAGAGDVWRAMSVSDPQLYAASVLVATLEAAGIRVTGSASSLDARELELEDWMDGAAGSRVSGTHLQGTSSKDPREGGSLRTLWVHHSAPLPELLHTVNHRSHNLFSEVLLKALGRQVVGDPSFQGGQEALTRYLVDVAGVHPDEIHVEDGSGLSRLNRASPRALVRVLEHMAGDAEGPLFRASIPQAGTRQGLSRMHRTPAAGNLRAKTGTIHRVSALSGVVTTAGGEEVLFSIIANDVPSPWAAKRVEDEVGARLASFSRPGFTPPSTLPGRAATGDRAVNRER
ncbi:MAG: D-alanyl-D-alanine carboxypeptidase/D-alanyl-D-alanine-endopeptidase [Gemmatimonadales bacterium]|nr:MAG: D-alanyl-D-alanine carboxypeptidase/D-alanyl-D-alanine-endopeptidase [Gemmatimonadales bacterium]